MLIKYQNLTIRNAVAADAEQLCAWWNDRKIMAQFCFPNGVGCTPEEIRQGIADNTDDNRHIIELDGKPIGEINYRDFCFSDGIIELDGKPIDEITYHNMNGD